MRKQLLAIFFLFVYSYAWTVSAAEFRNLKPFDTVKEFEAGACGTGRPWCFSAVLTNEDGMELMFPSQPVVLSSFNQLINVPFPPGHISSLRDITSFNESSLVFTIDGESSSYQLDRGIGARSRRFSLEYDIVWPEIETGDSMRLSFPGHLSFSYAWTNSDRCSPPRQPGICGAEPADIVVDIEADGFFSGVFEGLESHLANRVVHTSGTSVFTVVPEPSTCVAIPSLFVWLLRLRRRRGLAAIADGAGSSQSR